jgi:molecular chaperone Hsp33
MPFTSEEVIDQLQRNIDEFTSVTDVLKQGKTPEELLEIILKGFDIQFTGKKDVYFSCNCSQERGKQVISTLGSAEIRRWWKKEKILKRNVSSVVKNINILQKN